MIVAALTFPLLGIAGLGRGTRRDLVAEGVDRAGATGTLAVVPSALNLRKHLGDRLGHRRSPEIRARRGDPVTGPQLRPRVDVHRGRRAATPEQAVVGGRADLALGVGAAFLGLPRLTLEGHDLVG